MNLVTTYFVTDCVAAILLPLSVVTSSSKTNKHHIIMPSSIKKIVEGFPFQTIDPIVRSPTYKKIAEVHLKLNLNATYVHSNLGNGTLGILYLTLSPTVYSTL